MKVLLHQFRTAGPIIVAAVVTALLGQVGTAQDAAPQNPPAAAPPMPLSPEEMAAQVTLPKLQDLPPRSTEDLLLGAPLDWVVLLGDEVIVAEPISPRPNTLDQLEAAFRAKEKERRGKTGAELEAWKKELDDLKFVNVILPGPPPLEVRVARPKVVKIIHHEDHMLLRVDELLKEKNIELANELLISLKRQWPDWPGLAERMQAFLFTDAMDRLERGDAEACLMLAAELKSQKADYPGLSELAGGRLINSSERLRRRATTFGRATTSCGSMICFPVIRYSSSYPRDIPRRPSPS